MSQIVQFVETRERKFRMPSTDRYEFKPQGRWARVQRWAWRFLNWSGAVPQASDEKITYTRHEINTGDVMTRLQQARAGLFAYGWEPEEILIGSEDFAELMSAPAMQQARDFWCEYRSGNRIMGLKVRIIPWMRGVIVMPRER